MYIAYLDVNVNIFMNCVSSLLRFYLPCSLLLCDFSGVGSSLKNILQQHEKAATLF